MHVGSVVIRYAISDGQSSGGGYLNALGRCACGARATLHTLDTFKVERYLGKGQKFVVRNKYFSSDTWSSFKNNLNIPLYIAPRGYSCRKITENGALFITIRTLATLIGQNLQVFLWREEILGNHLLGPMNIIPARNSSNSSYLS